MFWSFNFKNISILWRLILKNHYPFDNIFLISKEHKIKMSHGKFVPQASNHRIILETHTIFMSLLHRLCSSPWTHIHPSPLPQQVPLSQVLLFLPSMILLLLLQCLCCLIPAPSKILFPDTIHHSQLFLPHQFILLPVICSATIHNYHLPTPK